MPTINEVWEQALQINANLSVIHNDLTGLKNCCNRTNDHIKNLIDKVEKSNNYLERLRDIVNDGFVAISEGIAGIHSRQDLTNQLLNFQTRQQETMICVLENISRNTCGLLNESNQQTKLQANLAENVERLNHMYASANPDAALIYNRHMEQREALEECCPPKPHKPICTYKPCPAPERPHPNRVKPNIDYKSKPLKEARTKDIDSK
ncbi:MAG: hypothetical protein ACFFCW_07200 [Candidatus Hodarchaeota archaeon]